MVAACPLWIYGCLVIALPFLVVMGKCYPIEQQLIVVNWCRGLHGWSWVHRLLRGYQLVAFTERQGAAHWLPPVGYKVSCTHDQTSDAKLRHAWWPWDNSDKELCYSSFNLSSIYAVKYHLTMCICLYQLSFLISMILSPRFCFPTLLDLPLI